MSRKRCPGCLPGSIKIPDSGSDLKKRPAEIALKTPMRVISCSTSFPEAVTIFPGNLTTFPDSTISSIANSQSSSSSSYDGSSFLVDNISSILSLSGFCAETSEVSIIESSSPAICLTIPSSSPSVPIFSSKISFCFFISLS